MSTAVTAFVNRTPHAVNLTATEAAKVLQERLKTIGVTATVTASADGVLTVDGFDPAKAAIVQALLTPTNVADEQTTYTQMFAGFPTTATPAINWNTMTAVKTAPPPQTKEQRAAATLETRIRELGIDGATVKVNGEMIEVRVRRDADLARLDPLLGEPTIEYGPATYPGWEGVAVMATGPVHFD